MALQDRRPPTKAEGARALAGPALARCFSLPPGLASPRRVLISRERRGAVRVVLDQPSVFCNLPVCVLCRFHIEILLFLFLMCMNSKCHEY